jgi:hypothetical protein
LKKLIGMSETNQKQTTPPLPAGSDPLGKLYHMSTTAGVGSHDYVAVNVVSVVAILLGLASSLALLDPLLLAIPILAFVFAVVSLRQIGKSAGTQTGRMLAWGGVAMAVLFVAMEGARILAEQRQDAEDRQAIVHLVEQFSQDIRGGEMDRAYALFSPDFHDRVSMKEFKPKLQLLQENPVYGKLEAIRSNGYFQFAGAYNDDVRAAVTELDIKFDKEPQAVAQNAIFKRLDGVWSINNIPDLFPANSQP